MYRHHHCVFMYHNRIPWTFRTTHCVSMYTRIPSCTGVNGPQSRGPIGRRQKLDGHPRVTTSCVTCNTYDLGSPQLSALPPLSSVAFRQRKNACTSYPHWHRAGRNEGLSGAPDDTQDDVQFLTSTSGLPSLRFCRSNRRLRWSERRERMSFLFISTMLRVGWHRCCRENTRSL